MRDRLLTLEISEHRNGPAAWPPIQGPQFDHDLSPGPGDRVHGTAPTGATAKGIGVERVKP